MMPINLSNSTKHTLDICAKTAGIFFILLATGHVVRKTHWNSELEIDRKAFTIAKEKHNSTQFKLACRQVRATKLNF